MKKFFGGASVKGESATKSDHIVSAQEQFGFPLIGKMQKIQSFTEIKVGSAEIVDDFGEVTKDRYVVETQNSTLDFAGIKKGLEGSAVKLEFELTDGDGHTSGDFVLRFVNNAEPRDWSEFSTLHVVCKAKEPSSMLRVCVIEEDGDWWNFINTQSLEADQWYWVSIPLDKMFVLEGFVVKGDGVQDLSRVTELRLIFDRSAGGQNPAKNTVVLDRIFLS